MAGTFITPRDWSRQELKCFAYGVDDINSVTMSNGAAKAKGIYENYVKDGRFQYIDYYETSTLELNWIERFILWFSSLFEGDWFYDNVRSIVNRCINQGEGLTTPGLVVDYVEEEDSEFTRKIEGVRYRLRDDIDIMADILDDRIDKLNRAEYRRAVKLATEKGLSLRDLALIYTDRIQTKRKLDAIFTQDRDEDYRYDPKVDIFRRRPTSFHHRSLRS